jgi:hypothetical protein
MKVDALKQTVHYRQSNEGEQYHLFYKLLKNTEAETLEEHTSNWLMQMQRSNLKWELHSLSSTSQ